MVVGIVAILKGLNVGVREKEGSAFFDPSRDFCLNPEWYLKGAIS